MNLVMLSLITVFYRNDGEQKSRFASEYAMRGLNEGFADFLSYRYNQVSNILQSGIDIKDLYETRDFEKLILPLLPSIPIEGLRFVKIHFIVSVPSCEIP